MSESSCGCKIPCKNPNLCPQLNMVENDPLYIRQSHGEIPLRAWSTWYFPDYRGGCDQYPLRVEFAEIINQIEASTYGDVKMNAFSSVDCAVGKGYFLADGRDYVYCDADGNIVPGKTSGSPDMRGKTPVMPDPGDYFCTGIRELGDIVGESAHLLDKSELAGIDFDIQVNIEFCIPTKFTEVEEGEGVSIRHFDVDGTGNAGDGENPNGANPICFTTADEDDDDNRFTISAEGQASSEGDPMPFNVMQPSFGMNFFVFMDRDGLFAKPVEGSQPTDRGAGVGYFTQDQEYNNCKPWSKKKKSCCTE